MKSSREKQSARVAKHIVKGFPPGFFSRKRPKLTRGFSDATSMQMPSRRTSERKLARPLSPRTPLFNRHPTEDPELLTSETPDPQQLFASMVDSSNIQSNTSTMATLQNTSPGTVLSTKKTELILPKPAPKLRRNEISLKQLRPLSLTKVNSDKITPTLSQFSKEKSNT